MYCNLIERFKSHNEIKRIRNEKERRKKNPRGEHINTNAVAANNNQTQTFKENSTMKMHTQPKCYERENEVNSFNFSFRLYI